MGSLENVGVETGSGAVTDPGAGALADPEAGADAGVKTASAGSPGSGAESAHEI